MAKNSLINQQKIIYLSNPNELAIDCVLYKNKLFDSNNKIILKKIKIQENNRLYYSPIILSLNKDKKVNLFLIDRGLDKWEISMKSTDLTDESFIQLTVRPFTHVMVELTYQNYQKQ